MRFSPPYIADSQEAHIATTLSRPLPQAGEGHQKTASGRYQSFNAASAAGFIGSASRPVGVRLTL